MELNYKKLGDSGEPLIILHGLMGSLDNWQTMARQLADHMQVYIVDQRNHGRSPHTDTHSYQDMVDDLEEFMQQRGLEKAHLLGHSMGGKVVMKFALQHPEKVISLVIADMGMRGYKPHHDQVFDALFRIDLDSIERRSDAEEQMEPLMPDYGMRQFLLKSLDRSKEGKYEWKFNLDVLFNEYHYIVEPVGEEGVLDVPVLAIRGGNSGYVNDDDIANYKEHFPQVKVVTIDGAGHWLHAEAPKKFLEALRSFYQI